METPLPEVSVFPPSGKRAAPGVFGRRHWRLWTLLAELVLLGGAFAVWHWPLVRVTDVRIITPPAWEDQVRALVSLPLDGNLLRVDPDAVRSRLQAVFGPRADVDVSLFLPSTLQVRLISRAPVLWAAGAVGIAADGALLNDLLERPRLPLWRSASATADRIGFPAAASLAAGTWSEVVTTDARYAQAITEWGQDRDDSWVMTAADGRTQILLGRTSIADRAAGAARLLDEPDSLLQHPCVIDARFAGQLIVRPLAGIIADSTAQPSDSLSTSPPTAGEKVARVRPAPGRRLPPRPGKEQHEQRATGVHRG